jgi:filamentous hemagglutinin family protein
MSNSCLRCGISALSVVAGIGAANAQDLPTGADVVAGDIAITQPAANSLLVRQGTDKGIINWQSFDIGVGHHVFFDQPGADAVTLNRVVGGNASDILGAMSANGTVMLVNPDGILFGSHASMDVGSLVATTHDILNDRFLAGDFRFDRSGNPAASIVNLGTITAQSGGFAALVAPGVRNNGLITAELGSVSLGSGNAFSLDLYGDSLITLGVDDEILSEVIDVATGQPLATHLDNQGGLSANGGTVVLDAVTARRVVDQVINNDGVIEANTVGQQGGMIVLSAGTAGTKTPQAAAQNVRVSGDLMASGDDFGEFGGKVLITGEMLELTRVNINANGSAGGGVVLVGGDYLGGRASAARMAELGIEREAQEVATATNVAVSAESVIDVSATTLGDGGKAVVWADGATLFSGELFAGGGSNSGDGGFVEISGQAKLHMNGDADTSALNGSTGTLLLDPYNLNIVDGLSTADIDYWAPDADGWIVRPVGTQNDLVSEISTDTIENLLLGNNVFITTSSVRVDDQDGNPITYNGPHNLNILGSITMPSNAHSLAFNNSALSSGGVINLVGTIDATGTQGSLTFSRKPVVGPGLIRGGAGFINFTFLNQIGSAVAPIRISVLPDDNSDPLTFSACAHFLQCSDTGTKLTFLLNGGGSFEDKVFIHVVTDAWGEPEEPQEPPVDPNPEPEGPDVPEQPTTPQPELPNPPAPNENRTPSSQFADIGDAIFDVEPAAGPSGVTPPQVDATWDTFSLLADLFGEAWDDWLASSAANGGRLTSAVKASNFLGALMEILRPVSDRHRELANPQAALSHMTSSSTNQDLIMQLQKINQSRNFPN